ncbi:MAG: Sec-independent protein translocase protein TatB [Pseudomonadota bacterium]
MFDVGLQELFLIGLIGLVVIGPKRLPKLARTLGVYVGKMRRFVTDVRSDVERELRAEELRQNFDVGDEIEDVKRAMESATSEFTAAHDVVQEVQQEIAETNRAFAVPDGDDADESAADPTTSESDRADAGHANIGADAVEPGSTSSDAVEDVAARHEAVSSGADPAAAAEEGPDSAGRRLDESPSIAAHGAVASPQQDDEITVLNPNASMHRDDTKTAEPAMEASLPEPDDEQTALNRRAGQDAGSPTT